jgi:hypothetical protein
VVTFNLNHEQAEALAARLATALQQDSQNPAEVLPPYPLSPKKLPKGWVYVDEEVKAEVKAEVTDPSKYCRVHPLPSLRPTITCRPVDCPHISTGDLHLACQARAQGYEENIGRQYVPFLIPGATVEKKPRRASFRST